MSINKEQIHTIDNKISQRGSMLDSMIEELRLSNLPTVFYGTSDAAKKLYKKFNEKGILIDAVMVSPEFYKEDFYFFDKKVYSSTMLLNSLEPNCQSEKLNIVVLFDIDDNCLDALYNSGRVDKIYFIDGATYYLTEFSYIFIKENMTKYQNFYNNLEDTISKDTMIGFINTRISGDASHIRKLCVPESYFPQGIIEFTNNEIFVDCGAYDGDTVEIFKQKISDAGKKYSRIYAFEPDKDNFEKLKRNQLKDKLVIPINKGVWDEKTTLTFSDNCGGGSHISNTGNCSIEVDKMDNMIDGPVSLIKMDLEGAELKALQGARNIIKNYKPKLAIAVYHKIEDLLEIPQFIQSLIPDYKFYLRAQSYGSVDMTLYAIPT